MTYAICSKCGESKVGALINCSNCQFKPTNEQDVDYAILLTDHFLQYSDLKEIGRKIKNKESFEIGYYFLPVRKRIFWHISKCLGLSKVTKSFFSKVEVKKLKSRVITLNSDEHRARKKKN